MNDVSPEIYEDIMARFEYYKRNNHVIERCEKRLKNKTANYRDAYDYATTIGSCMADAFSDVLKADRLPDGHMYYNIAQRTVRPCLEHVGELCGLYSDGVQTIMNKANGIGLKPVQNVYTN